MGAAIEAFMGQPHSLTHRLDPLLRERNRPLATELYNTVLQLEAEFVESQPRPDLIGEYARKIKELIRFAASELGVEGYRSSSSVPAQLS